MERRYALKTRMEDDFSKWYLEAIDSADLADQAITRGCMVIKPYGYSIWENIQSILDQEIKNTGHENCYFPLLIPLDLFDKESKHVDGFAKEMAVVTHHRLEVTNGKLVPSGPLETPLVIRPTSELIIGESFSKWAQSYRDLPIMINQWCNIVRWEMRTRMFLRTMEFLWQEGHTAHETPEEAIAESRTTHEMYYNILQKHLCLHGIKGIKPDHEKFPGAVTTHTIELCMQDGKALQACTSHYLGTNFAKANNIQFQSRTGSLEYAHTTSFGITTRIVGAIVMSHGDNDGINLPTSIAPYHVVIIPMQNDVLEYCQKIKENISKVCRVHIDAKDKKSSHKRWDYVRKGVPIICEIGRKEVESCSISATFRLNLEKNTISLDEFSNNITSYLKQHDSELSRRNIELHKTKMIQCDGLSSKQIHELLANENKLISISAEKEAESLCATLDQYGITWRCISQDGISVFGKSY